MENQETTLPSSLNLSNAQDIIKYTKKRARPLTQGQISALQDAILKTGDASSILAFFRMFPEHTDPNKLLGSSHVLYRMSVQQLVAEFGNLLEPTLVMSAYITDRNSNSQDRESLTAYIQSHDKQIAWDCLYDSFARWQRGPNDANGKNLDWVRELYKYGPVDIARQARDFWLDAVLNPKDKYDTSYVRNFISVSRPELLPELYGILVSKLDRFDSVWRVLTGSYSQSEKYDENNALFMHAVGLALPGDWMKCFQATDSDSIRSELAGRAIQQRDLGILSAFCRAVPKNMWDGTAHEQFTNRIREMIQQGELATQILSGDFNWESLYDGNIRGGFGMHPMMMHPMMMHPMDGRY